MKKFKTKERWEEVGLLEGIEDEKIKRGLAIIFERLMIRLKKFSVHDVVETMIFPSMRVIYGSIKDKSKFRFHYVFDKILKTMNDDNAIKKFAESHYMYDVLKDDKDIDWKLEYMHHKCEEIIKEMA